MASKPQPSISETIISHIPKKCKYKFIIRDDKVLEELLEQKFDMDKLDTLHNDELVHEALQTEYMCHQREEVSKAKYPTFLEGGIALSKGLITKADKKLLGIGVGRFEYNNVNYVAFKFEYELFDILEIFIIT